MNSNESFEEFNTFSEGNSLCFFHQNIRSLRENFDSFCIFLNSLSKQPEIIVLTEIWIFDTEQVSYQLAGYNQYAKCNLKQRAGGVVIYVSDLFSSCCESIDITTADIIKVKVDLGMGRSLSVVGIYRLYSFNIREYLSQLKAILEVSTEMNLLVAGDMNLCLLEQI